MKRRISFRKGGGQINADGIDESEWAVVFLHRQNWKRKFADDWIQFCRRRNKNYWRVGTITIEAQRFSMRMNSSTDQLWTKFDASKQYASWITRTVEVAHLRTMKCWKEISKWWREWVNSNKRTFTIRTGARQSTYRRFISSREYHLQNQSRKSKSGSNQKKRRWWHWFDLI